MELLSEETFAHCFSTADFLAACHQAFEQYGAGVINNPPRTESVEKTRGTRLLSLGHASRMAGKVSCAKDHRRIFRRGERAVGQAGGVYRI